MDGLELIESKDRLCLYLKIRNILHFMQKLIGFAAKKCNRELIQLKCDQSLFRIQFICSACGEHGSPFAIFGYK